MLRKLREKQSQLVELETSMGERIGDLLDQLSERDDRIEFLETRLIGAFTERKDLIEKIDTITKRARHLQSVVDESHQQQSDALALMEVLTQRVETLEQDAMKRRNKPSLKGPSSLYSKTKKPAVGAARRGRARAIRKSPERKRMAASNKRMDRVLAKWERNSSTEEARKGFYMRSTNSRRRQAPSVSPTRARNKRGPSRLK